MIRQKSVGQAFVLWNVRRALESQDMPLSMLVSADGVGNLGAMLRKAALLVILALAASAFGQTRTTIRMLAGPYQGLPSPDATDPRSLARRAVFEEFQRRNPDVSVVDAGGLELTGENQDSVFLMSMASSSAPDVFYVSFKQYYNYIDQGFCRPLDDLVAQDPQSIARMNPRIEKVLRSYDGQLYAIPWFQVAMALYYRKDVFADAGLDPNRPPTTWAEFVQDGRRIVESAPGRSGFEFANGQGSRAYFWVDFVWQAGGEVLVPAQDGVWQSAIDSPQAATALDFYRSLVTDKWKGKNNETYGPMATISPIMSQDIQNGKVGMWFSYTDNVVLNMTDLDPSLVGIAPMPAGPAGSANEINAGMWAINARIKDPKKLNACWRFIKYFAGDEAARINTKRFVDLGLGKLVNPVWLQRFGYQDVLSEVDPSYVRANRAVFKNGHPEPYGRNSQQAYVVLDEALDRATNEPSTPSRVILHDVAKEMNEKLLGYTPPMVMAAQRRVATAIFTTLLLVVGAGCGLALLRRRRNGPAAFQTQEARGLTAGINRQGVARFMTICLLPALLSILLWSYYPLGRGLLMAFQDYRIMKGARWVGFDNFISVFTSPIFYQSILNSFLYVALSLAVGFFLPVFLALALNEIPRAKILFRTIYYLPAMTSPLVITFLWRQFYDKSSNGILNSILAGPTDFLNSVLSVFHMMPIEKAHDWLNDPNLAMIAVVMPGIWAGAGPGSILYLAALKQIPAERFEAADMDGANWMAKIWHIVFPGLRVLILINLLGVFIANFKAMDSIFVLTAGGPLHRTDTIGLEIWTNAFMFLRFGYATAAAWVMGAILIGFTMLQIRSLTRVRFRAAGQSD